MFMNFYYNRNKIFKVEGLNEMIGIYFVLWLVCNCIKKRLICSLRFFGVYYEWEVFFKWCICNLGEYFYGVEYLYFRKLKRLCMLGGIEID